MKLTSFLTKHIFEISLAESATILVNLSTKCDFYMPEKKHPKKEKAFKEVTIEELNSMTSKQRADYDAQADHHSLNAPKKPLPPHLSTPKATMEYLLQNGAELGTKTGGILMPLGKRNKSGK